MTSSRPVAPKSIRSRPRAGEPDPIFSVVAAADDNPERIAVIFDGRAVRYADLAPTVVARASRLRKHLPEDPHGVAVAIEPGNDLETIVSIHAALALAAPILLLHPRRSPAERKRQLEIVRPALVVRGEQVRAVGDAAPSRYPGAGAILFTSGTAGPAKAAVLSRRGLEAAARASAHHLGWERDDRWLLAIPPAHIGGLSVILRCLAGRSAVVLGGAHRFSVARLARDVSMHRVTLLSLVPTQLHRLVEASWRPPAQLRAVLVGGGPATDAVIERARELGIAALPTYGLTEACAQVATNPVDEAPRPGKIGKALPGVKVRVVDGEIQVAGPTVFDGYLAQDGAGAVRVKSMRDEDGFFPTGDMGTLDDEGWLAVHGRRGDLIVTGGENVHPLEVETALERSEHIARACVFGVADDEWGQRVAVVVVPRSSAAAALNAIHEAELADYARPKLVALADELPITSVGKVDRRQAHAEHRDELQPLTGAER